MDELFCGKALDCVRRALRPAARSETRRRKSAATSIRVGADDFAAGNGPERIPGHRADAVLDVTHAPVREKGVDAARVKAAGRERHVRRPAVVLVDQSQSIGMILPALTLARLAVDTLCSAHGRCEPGVVDAPIGPPRMADRAARLALPVCVQLLMR